jgi:hypothetical protein
MFSPTIIINREAQNISSICGCVSDSYSRNQSRKKFSRLNFQSGFLRKKRKCSGDDSIAKIDNVHSEAFLKILLSRKRQHHHHNINNSSSSSSLKENWIFPINNNDSNLKKLKSSSLSCLVLIKHLPHGISDKELLSSLITISSNLITGLRSCKVLYETTTSSSVMMKEKKLFLVPCSICNKNNNNNLFAAAKAASSGCGDFISSSYYFSSHHDDDVCCCCSIALLLFATPAEAEAACKFPNLR